MRKKLILFDKLKNILSQENWVNMLNSTNVETAIVLLYFYNKKFKKKFVR